MILDLLDSLSDADLAKAAIYPDMGGNLSGGRRSIADMFHYAACHVDEQLLQAIQ